MEEGISQRKETEPSGSEVEVPLPLVLRPATCPASSLKQRSVTEKGQSTFRLSFFLLPQHRMRGYNLVPARVRGQEQMLSGQLARQFPIRLCFSSLRP